MEFRNCIKNHVIIKQFLNSTVIINCSCLLYSIHLSLKVIVLILLFIKLQHMQQQHSKFPIKRKPSNSKAIANRSNKYKKTNPFLSPVEQNFNQDDKKYLPQKQAERNIGQNISLIAKKQQGSFISNKQDQSLDSFDKMIMGVDEELQIEDQNTSNSKENDVNYTLLYREFEKLIKNSKVFKNDTSAQAEIEEENKILRDDFFQSYDQRLKQSSFETKTIGANNIRSLKQKIEQIKEIRKQKINQSNASEQNISLRMLGANLSEIHGEEMQHNTSLNRMDPIEEEFIDFVSKNNQTSKINISKIEKNNVKEEKKVYKFKNELNSSIKQPEEDEVVAMLENELGSRRGDLIEEESLIGEQSGLSKKKSKKQFFQKENYHQILRQLDQNEDKKLDNSNLNMSTILSRREEWVNNRKDRSNRWKSKELHLITKIKEILFNPYVEFSDDEQFNRSI